MTSPMITKRALSAAFAAMALVALTTTAAAAEEEDVTGGDGTAVEAPTTGTCVIYVEDVEAEDASEAEASDGSDDERELASAVGIKKPENPGNGKGNGGSDKGGKPDKADKTSNGKGNSDKAGKPDSANNGKGNSDKAKRANCEKKADNAARSDLRNAIREAGGSWGMEMSREAHVRVAVRLAERIEFLPDSAKSYALVSIMEKVQADLPEDFDYSQLFPEGFDFDAVSSYLDSITAWKLDNPDEDGLDDDSDDVEAEVADLDGEEVDA